MIIEIASAVSVFIFIVAYSHMITMMNNDRYLKKKD